MQLCYALRSFFLLLFTLDLKYVIKNALSYASSRCKPIMKKKQVKNAKYRLKKCKKWQRIPIFKPTTLKCKIVWIWLSGSLQHKGFHSKYKMRLWEKVFLYWITTLLFRTKKYWWKVKNIFKKYINISTN